MSKKLSVELSEAQARSLLWAIESLESLYCNPNDVDSDTLREGKQAMRNLAKVEHDATMFLYGDNFRAALDVA